MNKKGRRKEVGTPARREIETNKFPVDGLGTSEPPGCFHSTFCKECAGETAGESQTIRPAPVCKVAIFGGSDQHKQSFDRRSLAGMSSIEQRAEMGQCALENRREAAGGLAAGSSAGSRSPRQPAMGR